MRKLITLLLITLFIIGCTPQKEEPSPAYLKSRFQSVPPSQAILVQKGPYKESCGVCGMHLPTFYKTNHAAQTRTKEKRQYCSLHCVVHENEINRVDLYDVKVIDVTTNKFITAQSAFYVVGSKMPGTMTRYSKYAFAKRKDADAFAKKHGGHVMNFYDAYTVAIQDFEEE